MLRVYIFTSNYVIQCTSIAASHCSTLSTFPAREWPTTLFLINQGRLWMSLDFALRFCYLFEIISVVSILKTFSNQNRKTNTPLIINNYTFDECPPKLPKQLLNSCFMPLFLIQFVIISIIVFVHFRLLLMTNIIHRQFQKKILLLIN